MARSRRCAVAVALALLAAGPLVRAQSCPLMTGAAPTLAAHTAEERIDAIRLGLRRAAHDARIWAWFWAGIYSSLAVGQLASLPLRDSDSRIDVAIGAPAAAVGVLTLAILPLKVMGDQRRLDRLERGHPADRCALLAEAERLLVRDAASEAFGQSALVHAGNFLFNIGLGLALGLGFGHWDQAAITMATGFAIGELQTISQPMGATALLARYRAGDLSPAPKRVPRGWSVAPSLAPGGAGINLGITF
jgi:hypothetical protein